MNKFLKKIFGFIFSDINVFALIIMIFLMCYLFIWERTGRTASVDARVRTVYLNNQKIEKIFIRPGKLTVLSFPTKPDNSVIGMKDAFAISYVENDIIIGARVPTAHTNMFVYLFGRRFAFELITTSGSFNEIVIVKDGLAVDEPVKQPRERKHGR